MKVIILSENLKSCAERAMSICYKNDRSIFSAIRIIADTSSQRLLFNTVKYVDGAEHNLSKHYVYSSVSCACTVIEGGSCYIENELFKRLLSMKGEIFLTGDEETLKASSSKKKAEVPCKKLLDTEIIDIPVIDGDTIVSANKSYFLKSLKDLACFTKDKRYNRTHLYNISERFGMMRIAAASYAAALMNQTEFCIKYSTNFNIPNFAFDDLKSVAKGSKRDVGEDISIRINKDYVLISGCDFDYIAPIDHSEFLDIDRILPKSYDYKFNTKAKDLYEIASEYAKLPSISSEVATYPIYFLDYNGKVLCGTKRTDYITADFLETENFTRFSSDFVQNFNAKWIKDILSVFGDVDILVESAEGKGIGGWVISESTNPNNTVSKYIAYVLPIKADGNELEVFKSFMDT